jgi:DNA (cytosine-5)-methyltransferase 1
MKTDFYDTENEALSIARVMPSLTHGSLFSGIGGFDLASEWMGWENVFHCEWNDFGKRILKYYWPNAISYDDITKTDFTIHRGKIDILTGGFPCQPYSSAGKRKGKEDERHLWPEMLRAIREIQPSWVVGENVRGLTNWNGGMVFDEVQADLENEGYEVTPFLLPACAVNAPHRRDRIWFVAYSNKCSKRSSGESGKIESNRSTNNDEQSSGREQAKQHTGCSDVLRNVADTERIGQSGSGRTKKQMRTKTDREWKTSWAYDDGRWPTQSPVCNGNDGIPNGLDGITVSQWRQESIKAGGNAIVPQVAFQIFKAIALHDVSLSEA